MLGRGERNRREENPGWRRERGPLSVIPRVWTRVWAARSEGSACHQGVHATVAAKHSFLRQPEVAPGCRLEVRCWKQVLGTAVKGLILMIYHSWGRTQASVFHSVIDYGQFLFISPVFCFFSPGPGNRATFSETDSNAAATIPDSFGLWSVCSFVAKADVSILSVFSNVWMKESDVRFK